MDLRYPIGKFNVNGKVTTEIIEQWIKEIEELPTRLTEAVEGLNDVQLDTAYRSEGWTIRQVVHHIADSHLNSYTRFKLALTENNPTIKLYEEGKWAELPDSNLPVEISLQLIDALHKRWVYLLRSMTSEDLEKTFYHSEFGDMKLSVNIGIYAWHGRHHVAHITTLRDRLDW
ncbi:YfiT family bacillithiol transferase [Heyndrickxia sp. FSL K6-6286]|mgnify:CR=1|uniref:Putative metal-dependent hydrolase BWZ43_04815 n=1 Tax=Heyndrickxia oleronia TaxID=38875 RepID=A0A8E2LGS5_9BACI|nr:putative metal-dependent hydrolase [Heyndrickxia oleronia]NYV67836.1 putative metal-dependent hydrolase [Bacillus sp. Gen3]OJH19148.1 metal-dependent hydrolase [Bacillus obstructivus]MBU5210730.1 putative metal-dependent hydrolase [Heyndrickxia oleronia]MEC1376622.1 putative metal-dependent hydrolase [Heyndrickxia oleronia]OOP69504.1 metal-dependent hydrolase [Heyndrickxia oleronia]